MSNLDILERQPFRIEHDGGYTSFGQQSLGGYA